MQILHTSPFCIMRQKHNLFATYVFGTVQFVQYALKVLDCICFMVFFLHSFILQLQQAMLEAGCSKIYGNKSEMRILYLHYFISKCFLSIFIFSIAAIHIPVAIFTQRPSIYCGLLSAALSCCPDSSCTFELQSWSLYYSCCRWITGFTSEVYYDFGGWTPVLPNQGIPVLACAEIHQSKKYCGLYMSSCFCSTLLINELHFGLCSTLLGQCAPFLSLQHSVDQWAPFWSM
jgi:hypothetical protein